MSNLLNQKHALAKLKAELEGRRERICQCCRRFRHLACNCRNKNKEEKRKSILQNRFGVIASRVMQCGVKEKVEIRKQETVEEEVQCFRCQRIGHYKWECPVTKEEKERRSKKAACSQSAKGTAGREVSASQVGKGTEILWRRECARRCTAVGVRMDDRRSHSNLYRM